MHHEKARTGDRTTEKGTGATEDNRVNFNNYKHNC